MIRIDDYVKTLSEEEKITFAQFIQECRDREKLFDEMVKSRDVMIVELESLHAKTLKNNIDLNYVSETLSKAYSSLQEIYLNIKKVGGTC